jgi:hydrogenase/urease accessory protein HupE
MRRSGLVGVAAVCLIALASSARAHPVPFSYLDIHVQPTVLDITLVVHVVDVGHELNIEPATWLLDATLLRERQSAIAALVESRVKIRSDGRLLAAGGWSVPEPLPERQSIRLRTRYNVGSAPGLIAVDANFFPYDPPHQTFLNFYEGGAIATQAILDHSRTQFELFTGSRQGTWAVLKRFIPSGVHHILIGPDHLLFLVGLLLLGGTLRQLALVVTAFTLAHSVTLSLAALNILTPPARMIEPAIALSIVYVGADNLLVRNGRDVRAWIAFAFGFIHGFGFANVLAEMDLPRRALGWTLFSFNFGVEVGQLIVVLAVATALAALRSRSEWAGRQLAVVGSVVVVAAGTFWFIERVFFPGGIS